ncbi:acetylglutamate kinase [Shewanella sp. NIFS-20-20]|uniref:acetylglutamate kinase n=1 Tax=Shewanella sp. NIFS-20-20 TaxID=2853806 RepID=UPI001C47BE72|nr:acetylglutamate kinase [Shewanella sp. NIFS-20-20]MBV7315382.1 acetylglutamate kinase [Shewanella sp. NIFS-20-20]
MDKQVSNVLILKVGGALLECEMGVTRLMTTARGLIAAGKSVVIVHGGGCVVEQQLQANGMKTQKRDGLRITPDEQMPIIAGALAGTANKLLQAAAMKAGIHSVGLGLADGGLLVAEVKDESLGAVGKVAAGDPALIEFVLSQGWLPVISSIAISPKGQLLNVNADQAASAVTSMLKGQLVLLSDVSGVLDGKGQLISRLDQASIENLVKLGVIESGMKVKVEAALEVAQMLGQPVQVASWRDAQQMSALVKGEQVGTQIQP